MMARQIDNPMLNRPWLCRMARIEAVASLGLLPGPNPVSLRALHSIRRSRHRRELRALLAQPARCTLGNAFAIAQVAVLLPVGIYFGLLRPLPIGLQPWLPGTICRVALRFRGGIGEKLQSSCSGCTGYLSHDLSGMGRRRDTKASGRLRVSAIGDYPSCLMAPAPC